MIEQTDSEKIISKLDSIILLLNQLVENTKIPEPLKIVPSIRTAPRTWPETIQRWHDDGGKV